MALKETLLTSLVDANQLLESIAAPCLVVDKNRIAVFANRAFEALNGFSAARCPGVPCYHVARCGACVRECPVLKLDADAEPVTVETDMLTFSRSLIPVKLTVAPVKDADDDLAGFVETYYISHKEADRSVGESVYSFQGIVGKSPQMEKIFQMLPVLSQSDASVLVTGETGTGKDKVAEEIHNASPRSDASFVKVNCGALPETLLESELFGHTKGAFTGAVDNKPGRFRMAHNGTLYLTEIGDLPLTLQVKLLTVLDDGVVFPLGGTKGVHVNVRLVAATHRNLEAMVSEGSFRQDLFYRLNVARLQLPALRERNGDIPLLLDYFLHLYASRAGKKIKGFSDRALAMLNSYPYPGNVRELSNMVEYGVAVCSEEVVGADHLPTYLREAPQTEQTDTESGKSTSAGFEMPRVETDHALSWPNVEKKMILEALMKTGGHKGKAAALLGWGRSTLWRKMKQYGING